MWLANNTCEYSLAILLPYYNVKKNLMVNVAIVLQSGECETKLTAIITARNDLKWIKLLSRHRRRIDKTLINTMQPMWVQNWLHKREIIEHRRNSQEQANACKRMQFRLIDVRFHRQDANEIRDENRYTCRMYAHIAHESTSIACSWIHAKVYPNEPCANTRLLFERRTCDIFVCCR